MVNDSLTYENGRDASQFKCYAGQSVLVKLIEVMTDLPLHKGAKIEGQ